MKKFKKFLVFLVLIFALVAVVGCKKNNNDNPDNPDNPVVTPAITLPDELKATVNVLVGAEVDLSKVNVSENAILEFLSSDNSIVKIEGLKASALKAGEATITIKVKDFPDVTATIKVVVKEKGDEPHTHEFGAWQVTKEATCESEGEEVRTCACGETETRKIDKLDHDLKVVKLVPATLTSPGVMEHYECSMCHKLFDADKKEVAESALKIDALEGKLVYDPILGTLNGFGNVQIYDDKAEIDKGDIAGYVFGIDKDGKIVYASYFGDGYGGPADGFYHDGKYELTPGKVCAIFNVYPEFLPWPATTSYNGEEVNAWTLYDVVAPEGGYLISIKRGECVDFIKALTGDDAFVNETDNTLFETTVNDGSLNEIKVEVTKGIKNASFVLFDNRVYEEGLEYGGTNGGRFVKQDDGTYKATITLAQWNFITLVWMDAEGHKTDIWYDNTKFSGDVTAEDEIGARWDHRLYHEDTKRLYNCQARELTYDLVYNPDTKELTIKCHPIQDFALEVTGDAACQFTKNNDGKYEATVTLDLWKSIQFKATNEFGGTSTLWYNNTTFSGTITASDVLNSDNTINLYHEQDSEGKDTYRFYNGYGNGVVYHFVYDLEAKTLVVSVIYDEYFAYEGRVGSEEVDVKLDGSKASITLTLAQWNKIGFYKFNSDGTKTYLFYDNATVTGKVTDASTTGADWTENLYHEENDKHWYLSIADAPKYKFDVDFDAMTLVVTAIYDEFFGYEGLVGQDEVNVKLEGNSGSVVLTLKAWNKVGFYKFNSDGTKTYLFYDNATISGDVTAKEVEGADWTEKLYHEGEAKLFYCCVSSEPTYKFTYDFEAKTLTVKVLHEPTVTISGDYTAILAEENGVFEATFDLVQWNKIELAYVDAEGNATPIWYDNTTFSGYVRGENQSGADWTVNLYHEGSAKALYTCVGGPTKYHLVYDHTNNTLVVDVIFKEFATYQIGDGVVHEFTKGDDGIYRATVELSDWDNILLKFSNSKKELITIWYDNTTITGSVTAESVVGCDWTANLYHEENATRFYCYQAHKYVLEYDSTLKTLKVTVLLDPEFKVSGNAEAAVKASADGKFYVEIALNQWNKISLSYVDEFGEETAIWYDNTRLSGAVTAEGVSGADWTENLYHEGDAKDLYCCVASCKYQLVYDSRAKTLMVIVLADEELTFSGSVEAKAVKNNEGLFVAELKLKAWNKVTLTFKDKLGQAKVVWYDNTTVSGKVTSQDVSGADWTVNLYHEGEVKAFYCCVSSEPTYVFTYDPVNNTLVVTVKYDEVFSVSGEEVKKNAEGLFVFEKTLAQWNNVNFEFKDENGEATVVWYDNTTISGVVTAQDASGADWTVKLYHEGEEKKLYCCVASNPTYVFTYDAVNKTLVISIKPSLSYSGSVEGSFKDTGNGVYSAVVTLKQWNNIALKMIDENGEEVAIWYDNTTISGLVTAQDASGADWTEKLYHEGEEKKFYCCVSECTYKLVYDAKTKTLVVAQYVEPKVSYNGAQSGDFVRNAEGNYEAVVTLNQWNRIGFTFTDEDGNETVLWYDNTTFAGKVTSVATDGCDWTDNLFHEGADKQLLCYVGGTSYKIVYDLDANTLTVSIFVPESTGTGNYFVLGADTKIEISDAVVIYDDKAESITLGDYTIAVDATGKVIFASRTSSGYGGPGDGFYHDGTYQVVPGQVCGIFSLDSQFAGWPNTAVVNGETVNAWTLYTVVCPTGYHIITGSQAALTDLVKALCGVNEFTESNNSLFENQMEDGSITTTVAFEFNN